MTHERGVGAALFGAALLFFGLLAPYGLNVGEEGGAVYLIYRTLTGQRPYIDFFSGYAPGYFYWHALILYLSGNNLLGIRCCLALVNSLSVWLLYTIARSVLPSRLAVLPVLAYVALLPVVPGISCSFNVPYPSWYLLPFWLLSMQALRRWSERRRSAWLVLAGVLAGIGCSFKPNTGLFNLAADALCVVMVCQTGARREERTATVLAWTAVAGVVGGVMFVFHQHLWRREGWIFVAPIVALIGAWASRSPAEEGHDPPHGTVDEFVNGVVRATGALLSGFAMITAPWLLYYWWQLGWTSFAHNVLLLDAGYEQFFYLPYRALGWRDVLAAAGAVGLAGAASACRQRWLSFVTVATLLAAAATAVVAWVLLRAPMPEGFQRAVLLRVQDASFGITLLIHWTVIAALWVRGFPRMRDTAGRDLVFVLVAALFMFLSVYPRSDFFHVSFSIPLTLVLGVVLVDWWLQLWRDAVPAAAPWVGRCAFATLSALLVVLAAPQLALCRQVAAYYFGQTDSDLTRLRLRRAPLLVRNDAAGQAALNLEPVVAYLERERRPGDRLFTFPNLDLICFLADMHTPARIGYFNPGLPDHLGEAEVVDALTTHMPRFAVVSNPAPLFFADAPAYYFILRDFIESQYEVRGRAGSFVVLTQSGTPAGRFVENVRTEENEPPIAASCKDLRAPLAPDRLRRCLRDADAATLATLIQPVRDSESADAAAILAELWAQGALAQSRSDDLLTLRVIAEIGDARAGAALLSAPPEKQRDDMVSTALFTIAERGLIEPFEFGQTQAPAASLVTWSAYDAQLRRWAFSPDEDIRRRFFAAWALGHDALGEATPVADELGALFNDSNPGLQLAAAVALTELGGSADTGTQLLDHLSLSPSFLPSLVLRWSRRHPEVATPLLNRVLEHGAPAEREVVAFIAGVLRWPALVPALQEAAAATQPRVRLASAWALRRIGSVVPDAHPDPVLPGAMPAS